jgi:tetratricopeptide (TPR) repeat protein
MLKLGLIQMANGDLDTAYVTFTQVLHTRKKVIGCNHIQVAKILNLIGYLQYEFGSLLAALKSMEEALEILRDQEETTAADTLANMGFLYFKLQDYKEAIAVYQEAYYTQKRVLGDLNPKTIVTRENLEYVRQESSQSIMFKVRNCTCVSCGFSSHVCIRLYNIYKLTQFHDAITDCGSIGRIHCDELPQFRKYRGSLPRRVV